MGMLDSESVLAEGQAITAIGDTPTTNIYDTGGTNGFGDLGNLEERLWFNLRCDSAAASGGAATLAGVIQTSDDAATWTDLVVGPALPVASLTTGADVLRVQPPPINPGNPSRYYRGVFRVAVAALTAGTFSAFFSNTIQHNVARASGLPAQL